MSTRKADRPINKVFNIIMLKNMQSSQVGKSTNVKVYWRVKYTAGHAAKIGVTSVVWWTIALMRLALIEMPSTKL